MLFICRLFIRITGISHIVCWYFRYKGVQYSRSNILLYTGYAMVVRELQRRLQCYLKTQLPLKTTHLEKSNPHIGLNKSAAAWQHDWMVTGGLLRSTQPEGGLVWWLGVSSLATADDLATQQGGKVYNITGRGSVVMPSSLNYTWRHARISSTSTIIK